MLRRAAAGRVPIPRVRASWPAGGAIALTVAFVAATAWWLAVDRSVPYNDAAQHLFFTFAFHDSLAVGRWGEVLTFESFYPPATYLVGAASTFVGGVNVATPILAQNLLFVPLLAVACYQVGRMLGGAQAGLLAVACALG